MMIPLPGTRLSSSPLYRARWVRDIISFDGPLVAEFRNAANEPILFSWIDRDDAANRWLAFRVLERDLIGFTMRGLDLRILVSRPVDGFVYVVDIDESMNHLGCSAVNPADLPTTYIPDEGAVLPRIRGASKSGQYATMLDGNWDTDELFDFPNQFQQAYLALYNYGSHRTTTRPERVLRNHPWRGGFSSVAFYKRLLVDTPPESRPKVEAFAYASPGYVKWSVEPETARALKAAIDGYGIQRASIVHRANDALATIRELGLNERSSAEPELGGEQDAFLAAKFDELVGLMDFIDGPHLTSVHGANSFIRLKIILSIYRRIRFLYELSERGLVVY